MIVVKNSTLRINLTVVFVNGKCIPRGRFSASLSLPKGRLTTLPARAESADSDALVADANRLVHHILKAACAQADTEKRRACDKQDDSCDNECPAAEL